MRKTKISEKKDKVLKMMGEISDKERDTVIIAGVSAILENSEAQVICYDTSRGKIRILGNEASEFFDKVMERVNGLEEVEVIEHDTDEDIIDDAECTR